VESAVIAGPDDEIAAIRSAADDLRSVGRIADLRFASADELAVTDILLATAPSEEER
jgi:valyl-tRNA synthetase